MMLLSSLWTLTMPMLTSPREATSPPETPLSLTGAMVVRLMAREDHPTKRTVLRLREKVLLLLRAALTSLLLPEIATETRDLPLPDKNRRPIPSEATESPPRWPTTPPRVATLCTECRDKVKSRRESRGRVETDVPPERWLSP